MSLNTFVWRSAPFHCITDEATKFDPITVITIPGVPIVVDEGLRAAITGTGLAWAKVRALAQIIMNATRNKEPVRRQECWPYVGCGVILQDFMAVASGNEDAIRVSHFQAARRTKTPFQVLDASSRADGSELSTHPADTRNRPRLKSKPRCHTHRRFGRSPTSSSKFSCYVILLRLPGDLA